MIFDLNQIVEIVPAYWSQSEKVCAEGYRWGVDFVDLVSNRNLSHVCDDTMDDFNCELYFAVDCGIVYKRDFCINQMSANMTIIVGLHSDDIKHWIERHEGRKKCRICCKLNYSRSAVSQTILTTIYPTNLISDVRHRLRSARLLNCSLHVVDYERVHHACKARVNHFDLKHVFFRNWLHCSFCVVGRMLKLGSQSHIIRSMQAKIFRLCHHEILRQLLMLCKSGQVSHYVGNIVVAGRRLSEGVGFTCFRSCANSVDYLTDRNCREVCDYARLNVDAKRVLNGHGCKRVAFVVRRHQYLTLNCHDMLAYKAPIVRLGDREVGGACVMLSPSG